MYPTQEKLLKKVLKKVNLLKKVLKKLLKKVYFFQKRTLKSKITQKSNSKNLLNKKIISKRT